MANINAVSAGGAIAAVLVGGAVAWAGSQGGATWQGLPVFLLCAAFAFLVQWLVFVPSYLAQTEHYYDLTGSITYLVVIAAALLLTGTFEPRSLLIALLCGVWALRLGTFLFARVRKAGKDRRFTKMLGIPMQFFMTWTIQGLWVTVTLSAGLAAMTAGTNGNLDAFAGIGALIWLTGFAIEVIADRQKSEFRENNSDDFIRSGLWSWSRHPNYFGEIVLWIGIAVIALPTLEGWRWVVMISPVFVIILLTQISGVRMLEHSAKKRWGDDPEYQDYVNRTSVLVPLPPG